MLSAVNQYCSQLYPNATERNLQSQGYVSNATFASVLTKAK